MADTNIQQSKILIVDDEPANVKLLVIVLGNAGFANLQSATDPRQALPLFEQFQPDIVLLDLTMPHMDGFEVMARLRSSIPRDAYVPILVLTAVATPEAKRKALRDGTFNLIITDQSMPGMSGDQLASAIKQMASTQRIIMLTGFGDSADLSSHGSESVDLIISKPVSLIGLRQAIVGAMSR